MKKKVQDAKKEKTSRNEPVKPNKYMKKFIALGIVAAIVAIIAVVSYNLDKTTYNGVELIDGIECDTIEYGTFHVHAHLDVTVDGAPYTVPSQIGIVNSACLYWLHTHSTDGIIHIEAPSTKQFTLGQFFDIWRSTGSVKPPTGNMTIFVNGKEVNDNINNVPLNAHDEIVVAYGKLPQFVRPTYDFQGL